MLCIVLGACLLIWLEIIDLRIPATYIISFVVFMVLFGGHGLDRYYISSQLAGGGLMLGAFFMATDYVTRPVTKKAVHIWNLLRSSDRYIQGMQCQRGRCILCHYPGKSSGSPY